MRSEARAFAGLARRAREPTAGACASASAAGVAPRAARAGSLWPRRLATELAGLDSRCSFGAALGALTCRSARTGLSGFRAGRIRAASTPCASQVNSCAPDYARLRRRTGPGREHPRSPRRRPPGRTAGASVAVQLPSDADDEAKSRKLTRPPRSIVVLGAAAFCTMLAEGAAVDWSAVYLSHSFGAAAGYRSRPNGLLAGDGHEPRRRDRLEPPAAGPRPVAARARSSPRIGLGLTVGGAVPVDNRRLRGYGGRSGRCRSRALRAAARSRRVGQRRSGGRSTSAGSGSSRPGRRSDFVASAVGLRAALGIVVHATLARVRAAAPGPVAAPQSRCRPAPAIDGAACG